MKANIVFLAFMASVIAVALATLVIGFSALAIVETTIATGVDIQYERLER